MSLQKRKRKEKDFESIDVLIDAIALSSAQEVPEFEMVGRIACQSYKALIKLKKDLEKKKEV